MLDTAYNYNEKKIVAILSSKVSPEIALNIIGHLSVSLGATVKDSIMGRTQLVDKSNVEHFGISKYPFICTKVKPGRLRKAIDEARNNPNLEVHDFPLQMLQTGHDDELVQAIAECEEKDMEYLGALIYGDNSEVNSISSKFCLWKFE